MKNKRLRRGLSFLFLAAYAAAIPMNVIAAEGLTKEVTISASSEQDYEEQAEKLLPEILRESGKKYERTEIRYEVIDTEYLDKKEKVVETADPAQSITENGLEYTLVDYKEPESIEQQITAYDDYDHEVAMTDVPATKDVPVTNEVTGEQEIVTCSLTGISPVGIMNVNNTMTITFSNYDAAYYEWNGNYIPRNDQTPPLDGYESQLLAQAGASDGSVITGYSWNGEPYTVDGIVYRDAVANVQQPTQMYRALYEGVMTAKDPEASGTATYTGPDPNGEVGLTVKATAVYSLVESSNIPYILAGAGILVLVALVVILLMLLAKKRKEKDAV